MVDPVVAQPRVSVEQQQAGQCLEAGRTATVRRGETGPARAFHYDFGTLLQC